MTDYYLSIGSNILPAEHIPACMSRLRRIYPAVKFSCVYETDPVGPADFPAAAGREKFWNLAAAISTPESETSVRKTLRQIESDMGRVRSPENRFLPRTIDIDILPQAGYQQQAFIMIPLAEIAPQARDSQTGQTFLALAEKIRKDAAGFIKRLV